MRNDKENIIVTKTINFSLEVVKYCEVLEQHRKYVIANQLLRSATSIGQMFLRGRMQQVKLISFIK